MTTSTKAPKAEKTVTLNGVTYLAEKKKSMFMVDVSLLDAEDEHGLNPRMDYGKIDELAKSVRENGAHSLPPISVIRNGDRYTVVHGFRRTRACKMNVEKGIDVGRITVILMKPNMSKVDILVNHFTENNGKNLTLLEEAELLKKLSDEKMTQTDIAKRIGKTQGHVSVTLKLAKAPDSVKEAINKNMIAPSVVLDLIKAKGNTLEDVERIVIGAIDKLNGASATGNATSSKKVTASALPAQKSSKYHTLFTKAIELMEANGEDVSKANLIMDALDGSAQDLALALGSI